MHLMIDLETLDTKPTAVFSTVGLCTFDMDRGVVDRWVYRVDMQSSINAGRTISADTLRWWMRQDENPREAMFAEGGLALQEFLHALRAQFSTEIEGVWGNGATFDISILESAYHQAGEEPPWPFYTVRDVRTMAMLAPHVERTRPAIPHRAELDAEAQAQWVVDMHRALRLDPI